MERLTEDCVREQSDHFCLVQNIGIHDRRSLKTGTSILDTFESDYVMRMNYEMVVDPMIT